MPCPEFTFGPFCSKNCSCVQKNSIGCDKINGTCECKRHFYGQNCEQNLEDHKTAFDDLKTEVLQKLEKLTNDKAALEEQVGDYKYHLTWNSSFTCAAFVLLFVAISRMYLKNRKLKADLKVVSVRYSENQRNDSISESKVTFSCTETTHPSHRSNLFRSVLGKFRLLTQNVPDTSIDQPTYGTNLLEETDQINAEIYATIDELKEQNTKEEAIRMPEN